MSALPTYLLGHPISLVALALVCGMSAWELVLWANARSATKKTEGRDRPRTARDGKDKKTSSESRPRPTRQAGKTAQALGDAGLSISERNWAIMRGGGALVAIAVGLAANAPVVGVAGAALAIFGPKLWLASRCRAMETELEKQVLQLEMQMAENSRSGLSVERSLKTCLEHADQPIRYHLERIVNELTYSNRTLAEAFAAFAERTKSQDVAILASVIAVQQETGANLADTLDFLAQTIEEKQRMRLTLRGRVAEMRLTKTMVAAAPLIIVAMCCLFIGGVTEFYTTNPVGWVLLGVCGAIDLLGVLILNKLSDIPID